MCDKKRTRKSYLEPASELLYNNYDMFLNKVSPIGVIRNGNICDLLPVKMKDGCFIALKNTCGFDSLLQLLATAYYYGKNVRRMRNTQTIYCLSVWKTTFAIFFKNCTHHVAQKF